jgi:hypothetical protein
MLRLRKSDRKACQTRGLCALAITPIHQKTIMDTYFRLPSDHSLPIFLLQMIPPKAAVS